MAAASVCCKSSSTLHTHAWMCCSSQSCNYPFSGLSIRGQNCRASSRYRTQVTLKSLATCKVQVRGRSSGAAEWAFSLAPTTSKHQCRTCHQYKIGFWCGKRSSRMRGSVSSGLSEFLTGSDEGNDEAEESTSGAFVETVDVRSKSRGWLQEAMQQLQVERSQNYLLALAGLPGLALPLGLEGPQSVLQALGVLAAIITVHETGHFLAARLQGIHVTQFAIGFGPPIAKIKGRNVEYSLRAIPLGGYVAFPDDDPGSTYEPDDPDLLKNRSIPERALVISAGVIANIIFAYTVLFGQVLTVGLVEQEFLPGVVIPEVIPNSAAARAGIQAGDVVAGVDGRLLGVREASVFDLVDTIKDSAQKKLEFLLIRGKSELFSVQITPDRALDGSGRIGVQLSPNNKPHRVKATNLAEATVKTTKEFNRLFTIVTDGLQQVFFNFAQSADKLSGPVAIVAVGAEVARNDIAGLFQFAAIVNINLAVVNILPLPALDGGYLFLIALEALRGKKLPDGWEQGIMSSGILLLLALGVVLMVRDTINLGIMQQML